MKSKIATTLCLLCLTGLACGLIMLTVSSADQSVMATTVSAHNWYYKPRQDGGQPVVADDADFLEDYPYLCLGNAQEKNIYLTFDCGYDNGYIDDILDVLKEKNVCAAFFVTGDFLDSSPEIIKRMASEGHLVCNHGNTHKDLSNVSSPQIFLEEVQTLSDKYEQLTGEKMPNYIRPPEGKYSESFLKLCQEYNYIPVFWSFAYVDWYNDAQPSAQEAMQKIISRTHPGEIALLHATSKTNAEILSDVIDQWREDGYTLKTLDDLKAEILC